jgi:uncharacterized protein
MKPVYNQHINKEANSMTVQTAQATLLYQLQTIDLNLAKRRTRLKEITALLGDNQKVTDAQSKLTAAENALKPHQVRSRDLDLEIKSVAAKMKTTNDHLYSGKVRNPKEMQEMQDEITSLQKRQSQLEDELIETMLYVEEAENAIKAAQNELNTITATAAGEHTDLRAEQERLQNEVRQLEETRKGAAQAITPAALQKYESLRVAKKGQVVAPLSGQSCKLCGVEQTSSIVQKVHQGQELVQCTCGRILAMVP